ncbi:MAG: (deoxy)nucleoside triphosphate pyrophosphohydrolase [Sphaerochaeta sp.]|uniref:(deoxy)nucleoside triphosphate pyrophosphohydrolase n=1 Tax=Sphaerochaeta sp. TaxID=1972642 RepID=UPI003D11C11F
MQERITTAGILMQDGKYFIAKRENKGSIAGLWEFPGGKNRYGETEADTLKREFAEELGLTILVGELVCEHDFTNKDMLYHLKAYRVSADSVGNLPYRVHTEYRWVEPDELSDYPFAPSDQHIVAALQSMRVINT